MVAASVIKILLGMRLKNVALLFKNRLHGNIFIDSREQGMSMALYTLPSQVKEKKFLKVKLLLNSGYSQQHECPDRVSDGKLLLNTSYNRFW